MTTVGSDVHNHAEQYRGKKGKAEHVDSLTKIWKRVERLANSKDTGVVSSRIKFMLQDLLEMRNKGWVERRKVETAKTIEQIHKEVAKEERQAARRSTSSGQLPRPPSHNNLNRRSSTGEIRRGPKQPQETDKDGFTTVSVKGSGGGNSGAIKRSISTNSLASNGSAGYGWYDDNNGAQKSSFKGGGMRRVGSNGSFGALQQKNGKGPKRSVSSPLPTIDAPPIAAVTTTTATPAAVAEPSSSYSSPADCDKSSRNVLREYFVGGDADDAVLSLRELVGLDVAPDDPDAVKRGVAVLDGCLAVVLETRRENVDKYLALQRRCDFFPVDAYVRAFHGTLEYLTDIEIDAPLAGDHLARVVAASNLPLDFLQTAPDFFLTDGAPARFAAKVVRAIEKDGGDGERKDDPETRLEVVGKLMTEDDRASFATAKELVDSLNK